MSSAGDEAIFLWLSRLRKVYQPVRGFTDRHVEEGKITRARVEGFQRILDTILEVMGDPSGQRVVDIGSNLGYFCFGLSSRGAFTTGLERDSRRSELCRAISARTGFLPDNPRFLNVDAVEYLDGSEDRFDYVILLNVFHHILVNDEVGGWRMFNRLIEESNGVVVMMRNSLKGWKLCETKAGIPEAVVARSSATGFTRFPRVHGREVFLFYGRL